MDEVSSTPCICLTLLQRTGWLSHCQDIVASARYIRKAPRRLGHGMNRNVDASLENAVVGASIRGLHYCLNFSELQLCLYNRLEMAEKHRVEYDL